MIPKSTLSFPTNSSLPVTDDLVLDIDGYPQLYFFLDVHGDVQPNAAVDLDRKSTRLNSSHVAISYAVFCLITKTIYTCDYFSIFSVYTLSIPHPQPHYFFYFSSPLLIVIYPLSLHDALPI